MTCSPLSASLPLRPGSPGRSGGSRRRSHRCSAAYAPSAAAEWFLAWGLRFPDGGSGWDGADPPLPRTPHAIVAVGGDGSKPASGSLRRALPSQDWSVLDGEAAFVVAALRLDDLPAEPGTMATALAEWMLARLEELRGVLPDLAAI